MVTQFLTITIVFLVLPLQSYSIFHDTTEPVPIDRLIKNISQHIKEHPGDAHGYYVLGRIHSLAYAKKEEIKVTYQSGRKNAEPLDLPQFSPYSNMYEAKVEDKTLSQEQKNHLLKSVQNYFIATRKNPDKALYFLGLAWMLEQGIAYAEQLGLPPLYETLEQEHEQHHNYYYHERIKTSPVERLLKSLDHYNENLLYCMADEWDTLEQSKRNALLKSAGRIWFHFSLNAYRRAYNLEIYEAVKIKSQGYGSHANIETEAGKAIIRLLEPYKVKEEYMWEINSIQEALKIASSGGSWITPIIFSLTPSNYIDDLLDPSSTVSFDMNGNGKPFNWSWVNPNTAILVWDPKAENKITSGRQLFGSVTFYLFWQNGYQAMNSLDNNRDGYLKGDELTGLAVWQDHNQNGKSEPGEVTPIENTMIQKLATKPDVNQGKSIYTKKGIQLKNGEWLPSYDWFPKRVE